MIKYDDMDKMITHVNINVHDQRERYMIGKTYREGDRINIDIGTST